MGTHPSPLAFVDDDDHACTIWYIAQRLGRRDYSAKRLVAYVGGLIDSHDFPKPFPREQRGGGLTLEVGKHSRWPRAAVDQWLHGWLPPEAGAALDAQARREAAEAMDARAGGLQLGRHRRIGNGRSVEVMDGGRA
jgi:hypothetical protein